MAIMRHCVSGAELKYRSSVMACAAAVAVMTCIAPAQALAQGAIIGVSAKITFVEATYIPDSITFMIDQPLGTCPAGSLLRYFSQGVDTTTKSQNIAAVFSLMLTAKVSNQIVTVSSYSPDCAVVRFVSLV